LLFAVEGKGEEMLFLPHEEGQGLLEYGLVLVLVAVIIAAVLLLLGPVIGNMFSTVVEAFP
jgi:pilus assembly protein Flp/PilA